mgnify:CR=1 FL=1
MAAAAALNEIDRARDILRTSRGIVVLTGAGLSVDSGLATFRGPEGHWRKYRPEDLATLEAFRRDACLVWEWYDARRRAAAEAAPNDAHRAIAEFALHRDDVVIVTQNVDGLHTLAAREAVARGRLSRKRVKAPHDPADIKLALPLELHGTFYNVRCTSCGRRQEHRDLIDVSSAKTLPHCDDCGTLLRPDVVWFGEPLGEVIERAFGCAARSEVCLVVGTSAVVQPAASVAMVTHHAGGVIIEVNPDETPLTPMCEVSLRYTAAMAVPALLEPYADG